MTHFLSKMNNELLKFNNKKTTQLKWTKDLNGHHIKEDILMANKHMKTCPTSYVQANSMRTTLYLLEWPKSRTLITPNACKDMKFTCLWGKQ